jgi:hypothetical protein
VGGWKPFRAFSKCASEKWSLICVAVSGIEDPPGMDDELGAMNDEQHARPVGPFGLPWSQKDRAQVPALEGLS